MNYHLLLHQGQDVNVLFFHSSVLMLRSIVQWLIQYIYTSYSLFYIYKHFLPLLFAGILHSGYGAEFAGDDCYGQKNENRIWSHQAGNLQWSHPQVDLEIPSQYYVASALRNKCKSEIVRVGIVAHEIGHQLGLPDLYDKTWEGNGIGNFDQMARCWGWDGSGLYPPTLSAWSKIALNWLTPLEISSSGSYALGPSAQVPHAYIIKEGYPEGEYLLIENRQPIGFDAQLPQGGIAIWHIDEKADDQNDRGYLGQEGWPKNGNHYKVALLQADGNHDLEMKVNTGDDGDLWHNNSKLSILGPSIKKNVVPNSDAYQDGNVYETGIWIHEFSESGTYMSFEVKGLNGATSTSYLAPSDATLSVSNLFPCAITLSIQKKKAFSLVFFLLLT